MRWACCGSYADSKSVHEGLKSMHKYAMAVLRVICRKQKCARNIKKHAQICDGRAAGHMPKAKVCTKG
jgi:hypothetical protein